jgi:hypothetical protein
MEPTDLTPYHGRQESHSKFFLVMSLCFSTIALGFLALSFFSGLRSNVNGHGLIDAIDMVAVAVTVLATAVVSLRLFTRLRVQIEKGGENAEALDQIRLDMSAMAQAFSIALMFLAGMLMRR